LPFAFLLLPFFSFLDVFFVSMLSLLLMAGLVLDATLLSVNKGSGMIGQEGVFLKAASRHAEQ
jgi:hypothetical protein